MDSTSIYGAYEPALEAVMQDLIGRIRAYSSDTKKKTGEGRLRAFDLPPEGRGQHAGKVRPQRAAPDSPVGAPPYIRCHRHPHRLLFFSTIFIEPLTFLKSQPDIRVVEEKDYIRNVKPNGYRSYHLILELQAPYEDVTGANPGRFYAEVQLRTIAMDYLGQPGTPDEVQAGYQKSPAHHPGIKALCRRAGVVRRLDADHPQFDPCTRIRRNEDAPSLSRR